MFKAFINIFRVRELRNKILFTLLMLAIYRVGFSIPLPGVDQAEAVKTMQQQQQDQGSAAGRVASYLTIFSGGSLSHATIFGLGVMPYISASIIFQLLGSVVPSLEKMQKEGESGRRKIQEWSRYATVPLAIMQGVMWLKMTKGQGNVYSTFTMGAYAIPWWVMSLTILTAGSLFLMWLGEQIDEYGLGNGVSMIIMAGILSQLIPTMGLIVQDFQKPESMRSIGTGGVVFLICSFIMVNGFAILITQAQRRIPIQQAKFTRGRRVYGGQKQFLPLRLNHGGVMPVIFAQSIMLFPGVFFGWLHSLVNSGGSPNGSLGHVIFWLNQQFHSGQLIYALTEVAMIYFFAYFWTTVQFKPKEMANQLRDYGSFVPGIRPGPRTAEYLESVMYRITFVGAAFLCAIAIIPTVVATSMNINYQVASFLGGTGLLIVISVSLDMVQRIEANLLMRNYGGFLSGEGGKKGKRIRGRNG